MDQELKGRYERRAQLVKAMAHPTRLFLVDRLSEKEYCVQELTAMVGDDISTVSKHLALLKQAGVLQSQKRANCVYYSLKCPCVMKFFACVEGMVEGT